MSNNSKMLLEDIALYDEVLYEMQDDKDKKKLEHAQNKLKQGKKEKDPKKIRAALDSVIPDKYKNKQTFDEIFEKKASKSQKTLAQKNLKKLHENGIKGSPAVIVAKSSAMKNKEVDIDGDLTGNKPGQFRFYLGWILWVVGAITLSLTPMGFGVWLLWAVGLYLVTNYISYGTA